jgi:hypothetical protein
MTRSRAADDFAVIRARIEGLRRSRVPTPAEPQGRPLPPHKSSAVTPKADPRRLPLAIRQRLFSRVPLPESSRGW